MEKNVNMIISSFYSECELLGILNDLHKNKLIFGQRIRRWSNNNIIQTLGHPHCDNNYATLFVESRVCNYVRPNYARIIY